MKISSYFLGATSMFAALLSTAFGSTLSGNLTITAENVSSYINPAETLKISPSANITFASGLNLITDLGKVDDSSRYTLMNAGNIVVESGANIEMRESYSTTTYYAQTVLGAGEVSGTLTFRDYNGVYYNWILFSNYNYTVGGITYPEGVFRIKNGGRINAFVGADTTLARARIYGSGTSEFVVESGGTFCVQAVVLCQNGILSLEKDSNLWGAFDGTSSPFIIAEANKGYRSVINVWDGFRTTTNEILMKPNSNLAIRLPETKAKRVSLDSIKGYSTTYAVLPNIHFYNFRNDYILIRDTSSVSISSGKIKISGFNTNVATMIDATAYAGTNSTGTGYSDGWNLVAYYRDGKLAGYWLNNSNFPRATPYEPPASPAFEIQPQFENTTVTVGVPFKFKFTNVPEGATYILMTNENRQTVSTGALKSEMEFTINEARQAELKCVGVFDEDSAEYAANMHRFAFMVSPADIKLVNERPADFDEYWAARKAEIDPIPPTLNLEFVSESDGCSIYRFFVKCDNYEFYNTDADFSEDATCTNAIIASGYLCFPTAKAGEKLPIIYTFYGAGTFSATPSDPLAFAKKGYIGFSMNPHPLSQMDLESTDSAVKAKAEARQNMIKSGRYFRDRNVAENGKSNLYDRSLVYFNGMFKRDYQALRAAMAMVNANGVALPKWDGKNLAVRGVSMGGAQTLAAAYLCPQVSVIAPMVPALGDIAGLSTGRYAGWPYWVDSAHLDRKDFTRYFDTGLMAQTIQSEALVVMGLIDTTCCPQAVSAIRNAMKGKSTPYYMQRTGHSPTSQAYLDVVAFLDEVIARQSAAETTPYDHWVASEGLWGESALPDKTTSDGTIKNLEKYVYGSAGYPAVKASASGSGNSAGIGYSSENRVQDVTLTPYWSIDLKTWNKDGLSVSTSKGDRGETIYDVKKSGEQPSPIFYKVETKQN